MAKPLYGKGMTINFSNYYASPAVTIEFLKNEVYCWGTLRKNKRLIPSYILFTKSEARNNEARGATKITVNKKYSLVAVGWIDGEPSAYDIQCQYRENGDGPMTNWWKEACHTSA